MAKTKIICTIGPASESEAVMRELLKSGMNVARFNLSHDGHPEHRERIKRFRDIRDEMKISAAVLLDTKGPEIRIGKFVNNAIFLKENQEFILTSDDILGDETKVSVSYKNLPREVMENCKILIDDGMIELRVDKIIGNDIFCIVVHGGRVSNRKGVNIPTVQLKMPYLSENDKSDLLFCIEQDVDYIAASFIRTEEDVNCIKGFLEEHGSNNIKIISKIENQEGIDNFDEILKVSDGIMVARGDMGVEVDYEKLPGIQKHFISKCYKSGKVVITATQMLDSMINNPIPTRAEISDVANAVFDGTSAIMLSGETASGKYPIQALRTMRKIATRAEEDAFDLNKYDNLKYELMLGDVTNAICDAACTTARDVNAKAIIAVTQSGKTARSMSKFRPKEPIIGATPFLKTYHQLAMNWGVYPVISTMQNTTDDLFKYAVSCAKSINLVKEDDLVVITAGVPLGITGGTNIIKVEIVK